MERFYASRLSELVATVRSGGDVEIEEQLLFCEQWGGPLAAAAQVALAWVVERRSWGGDGQARRDSQQEQLQLPVKAKPKPAKPTPDWVKERLRSQRG